MKDYSKYLAVLQRKIANSDAVNLNFPRNNIGELFWKIQNIWSFFCFTIEDEVRMDGVKVYGLTCVEGGKYWMQVTYSNTFKRELVLLTPMFKPTVNFSGLRLHGGTTEKNTLGCICMEFGVNKEKTKLIRINKNPETEFTNFVKKNKGGILLIENKQLSSNDELNRKMI